MRRFAVLTFAALAATACSRGASTAPPSATAAAQMQTIDNVPPRPAQLQQPSVLQDEAPPPKPKVMPWETPTPVVMSPEDEKLRANLPFSPAIAMDPIDGSKISIRASTPTVEFKGKIFYFSSEENKRTFSSNPSEYMKEGFTKL
ncbi:MAG TPA: YHS domain-containing protein [Thermoanaerobaculia bacterium]|nr:YHS domain-containing protein [Thermoanaerobaculia bacterium]